MKLKRYGKIQKNFRRNHIRKFSREAAKQDLLKSPLITSDSLYQHDLQSAQAKSSLLTKSPQGE